MSAFEAPDVSKINSDGLLAFESSGLAESVKTQMSSTTPSTANAALTYCKQLCEGVDAWIEPHVIAMLPAILDNLATPKTAEAASAAGNAVLHKMCPHSMKMIQDLLYESMGSMKWQTKKGALVLLGNLAQHHPNVVTMNLPSMILKLIEMSSDVKKEVKDATRATFVELCGTITNVDIIPIIPRVVAAYMDPVKLTADALEALISTTFINDVDLPTLGLLVPVLTKGMRERLVATKRRAALVIGNMCKLVNDPRTAAEFYPILKPVLERGIEEIAVDEVRKVCQDSLNTLQRVSAEASILSDSVFSYDQCLSTITEAATKNGLAEVEKYATLFTHMATMCRFLVSRDNRKEDEWKICLVPYLKTIMSEEGAVAAADEVIAAATAALSAEKKDLEEEEEDLCNAVFSLAYGTRVLLHQTPFKVKIGRKYGLVGPNGAGKSTLMRAIAGGNLQGFPTELITVYVECEIIGEHADKTVLDYVMSDPKVIKAACDEPAVRAMLSDLGFGVNENSAAIDGPVAALSGGWRMKLALCRAMLLNPDMLLLDEPTNHLDQFAVRWLTEYVINLKTCTCLIVSHDTKFLDNVCTNIIHYENLKLKSYRGNLSDFVKQKPEAKAYYELSSETVSFEFPEPGPLEGVKSLTKAVLKAKGIHFQYPGSPRPQLIDVGIQCSLASRVAVVGVNGAGKSTLVKLMVGELEPDQGTIERHPNLRVAYVAQHAFTHIESHLEMTPCEYVMWRYRGGVDKEMCKKDANTLTKEEIKAIRDKAKEEKTGIVEELLNRRTGKREHEYECIWEGLGRENSWLSKTELITMGYQKMITEKDEQIAMESMLGQRKLTTGEIQKHFDGFGLEPQFAQHTRMGALSGGQKVKVVLGAGLWNLPHLVILDEPTNFLDRDSLGALATAIKNFKGGIFMISHHAEFYEELCPEKWMLEGGRLTVMGAEWMEEVEKARKKAEKLAKKSLNLEGKEEKFDALGNSIAVVEEKKELSRDDKKRLTKLRKDMIKRGEDTYEIDQQLGLDA